jgi:hypothetical protein
MMDIIKKYSLKTLDNLIIDTSGDKYAVRKNEEEGIKDIKELVHSSKLEGAWAYLPKEELWIWVVKEMRPETMIDRKEGFYSVTEVECDYKFTTELGFDQDFIAYHLHTNNYSILMKSIKDQLNATHPNIDREIVEEIKKDFQQNLSLKATLPSGADIGSMIDQSKVVYGLRPQSKTSHKVCSSYGVSEYFLNGEGRKFFDFNKVLYWNKNKLETNQKELELMNEKINEIMEKTKQKILGLPLETNPFSKEKVDEMIEEIKHPYFEIVFTPYVE